ncbi:polysaccharide deacetylase family protein [Cohnella caldifontis]|uniref:polysaccharide deacetylase family protein n=1 Tax=Cohnella caldifontis TaxID=3027471 RepID=UPI0023EAD5D9|nr:polysaccharide deacetylase family protein [Cohnella sp. YIM B05605]
MPKRKSSLALAAACSSALLLGLTACGDASPAATAPSSAIASAAPSSAVPTASAAPASPSASASAAPSAAPGSSPAAPQASPEPTEKAPPAPAYKMNKAYFIVPIDKQKTANKVVLLTFDDGPKEQEMLGKLLDTLDKHHAKAIFFVNGYRIKAHPELLKEIDERGQTIGNHSYDHIMLGKEKEDKIREQIESVQKMVLDITGKTPVFFRPPFASANDAVHRVAKENGLMFMTWSNGSLDWDLGKNVKDKPQAVIDNVMKQLNPGSNILMHELPWTADALDRLLTQLEDKGYSFVDPAQIELKTE